MTPRKSLILLVALGLSILPFSAVTGAATGGLPAGSGQGLEQVSHYVNGTRGATAGYIHHLLSPARLPASTMPSSTIVATQSCTLGNFPASLTDSNAHYWLAVLVANPQVTLTVTGIYPSARYASLQAYNGQGDFIGGLTDKDFPPDSGSENPFVSGTQRGTGSYTLHVVFAPAPVQSVPGTLYLNVAAGTGVALVYRIFLPDTGATTSGNVPLPSITAQLGATGAPTNCPEVHTVSSSARPTIAATATAPRTASTPPPGFFRLSGQQLGGFGNVDAAYLVAGLTPPTVTVPLYVVRFQAPTTPHTLAGGSLDPTTQLRYWSLCVYSYTKQPYQCLADEQLPVDQNGMVTVVMGPWWAWPSNATRANGVVWVGLGWFFTPYIAILRQLVPAPGFTSSAFALPDDSPAAPYMGSYAPVITRCTTAQFETNRCSSS